MPTPNDSSASITFTPSSHLERNSYITCPPEDNQNIRSEHASHSPPRRHGAATLAAQQPARSQSREPAAPSSTRSTNSASVLRKMPTFDDEEGYASSSIESGEITESGSSVTAARARSEQSHSPMPEQQQDLTRFPESSDVGFRLPRMIPVLTSSFLRPFSKFIGQQQSDKQMYQVEVELKYVDMAQSSLCGYLKIEGKPPSPPCIPQLISIDFLTTGLTPDHPTLTTYFDGEIIGPKYTFQTRHPSWGATDKTDMQHWNRFPAWRQLGKQAKKPDFHYKNFTQRENIFMRWKESFLVPDHRVREISGASFEGFYYICFNQISGDISGIYFHAKSEKFQQLELKHVDDRGCFPAIEFR
ncbi:MAG: hypothetical protein Q9172_006736 [Xanthocarpia lactea]